LSAGRDSSNGSTPLPLQQQRFSAAVGLARSTTATVQRGSANDRNGPTTLSAGTVGAAGAPVQRFSVAVRVEPLRGRAGMRAGVLSSVPPALVGSADGTLSGFRLLEIRLSEIRLLEIRLSDIRLSEIGLPE
jgi:hypothetical protein